MNCKVRFAPSPTGFMHIGNARIAIINYLFCKQNKGKYLFRIDDTDVARSKKEYEDAIIQDLKWLGISWDETFRQSERLERYKDVMNKLIAKGILYECFETQEELDYKRKIAINKGIAPVYDRSALKLSDVEKERLRSQGIKSYWRFKLPNKTVSWNDLILGEISYALNSVSDPVIVKADGTFLYTFSSVIDDIDSGITHIIRGQDHVTNTAVQIAMFDEISDSKYQVQFAHLSLLVNKDGSQFSKRLGSMNLSDIRNQGVDPMAISDLLATLGSSLDTMPFTNMNDLVEYFDITKFSTNSPKFDMNEILNVNKKIMHQKNYEEIKEYGISEKAFEIIKDNISTYNDFNIWKCILDTDYKATYKPNEEQTNVIKTAIDELQNSEIDENVMNRIKEKSDASGKALYIPLRMALTDMEHGPNLLKLLELFGKEIVLKRFTEALKR
ncbi:MAG: glutamate--tRNA ligase [Alphaproteobacteria bacterium]|nr:glutamate--tRNA ligase [Alphaproteobacteria bacterium]